MLSHILYTPTWCSLSFLKHCTILYELFWICNKESSHRADEARRRYTSCEWHMPRVGTFSHESGRDTRLITRPKCKMTTYGRPINTLKVTVKSHAPEFPSRDFCQRIISRPIISHVLHGASTPHPAGPRLWQCARVASTGEWFHLVACAHWHARKYRPSYDIFLARIRKCVPSPWPVQVTRNARMAMVELLQPCSFSLRRSLTHSHTFANPAHEYSTVQCSQRFIHAADAFCHNIRASRLISRESNHIRTLHCQSDSVLPWPPPLPSACFGSAVRYPTCRRYWPLIRHRTCCRHRPLCAHGCAWQRPPTSPREPPAYDCGKITLNFFYKTLRTVRMQSRFIHVYWNNPIPPIITHFFLPVASYLCKPANQPPDSMQ